MPFKPPKNHKKKGSGRPAPHHHDERPMPWKMMFLIVGALFFTGLLALLQNYSAYFSGSIVGQPSYILAGYNCPQSSFSFESSPVPDLFEYRKGNTDFNRRELLRINKRNHGITSWYTYDKGFDEGSKAAMIDAISYEKNFGRYLSNIYEYTKNDSSPHGGVDLVTKWLAPENVNMPTVFPYGSGLVIDAKGSNAGYGNYVSVCTDLVDGSGNKLRVLYNVAHLDSISVSDGQTVSAGTELGRIGTTGRSTTPHAHITIHPDLVWVQNYKEVYNAGYKFYYSTNLSETLVKTIDPIAAILNPDMAYSIALDDNKRQKIFESPSLYIASLTGAVVSTDGGIVVDNDEVATQEKVFSSLAISVNTDKVDVNQAISVTVKAIDQTGGTYPDYNDAINVVLSSSTASFNGVDSMSAGKTTFEITDSLAGEVIIQVSNHGTISAEKKVWFDTVAVVDENITTEESTDTIETDNTDEEIATEDTVIEEPVIDEEESTEEDADVLGETVLDDESDSPVSGESVDEAVVELGDIDILSSDEYRIYNIYGDMVIVFNDNDVQSEFPVQILFTVPEGTTEVSIFSGYNTRNFPESGELKLSKYTPGQEVVRYYPKYVEEDSFKKIVAYKDGVIYAEQIFTWTPMSQGVFLDVVDGVTDREVYEAVKALKETGVFKGNPDGTFGVNTPINRAGTATVLIRSFYSDIDLETIEIGDIDFSDVPEGAWYESAIWFASQGEYEGLTKPVIIKGYDGKANPDGNVKLEEFVTMILRVLEIDVEDSEPWYESYIARSIELGLITEEERELIDKPLSRGLVARIMIKALELAEEMSDGTGGSVDDELVTEEAGKDDELVTEEVEDLSTASIVDETVEEVVEAVVVVTPIAAANLTYQFSTSLKLSWESEFSGPFNIYRETVGGNGEIFIGNTGGTAFTDTSAKSGRSYYYRVEYSGESTQRAEILVEL